MYINAGNAEYSVSTAFTRLKASKLNLPVRRTEEFLPTHFGTDPPIFFMNIITSDSLKLPRESVPIVS